jgi:hypothetical protein
MTMEAAPVYRYPMPAIIAEFALSPDCLGIERFFLAFTAGVFLSRSRIPFMPA